MRLADLDINWKWLIAAVAAGASWIAYAEVVHQKVHTNSELVNILGQRAVEEDAEEKGVEKGEQKKLEEFCDKYPNLEECKDD